MVPSRCGSNTPAVDARIHAPQVHWYADLSALVERAVAQAGGMPATLVCHSMGTQVAHYFLSNVTAAPWRAAHISGFFAMGPVLGGAETALSCAESLSQTLYSICLIKYGVLRHGTRAGRQGIVPVMCAPRPNAPDPCLDFCHMLLLYHVAAAWRCGKGPVTCMGM